MIRLKSCRLSGISRMLCLSVAFTMVLLGFRMYRTGTLDYSFYIWNTFLAVIPYFFSTRLAGVNKITFTTILLLAGWLLFFPNAPYIITDLFHFEERPGFPVWYDLILVSASSWNGLILGIVSLMQVERFLRSHMKPVWAKLGVFACLLLCGYGIFIGRFLRFNSWDIISHPKELAFSSASHVLWPQQHLKLWVFTFLFAALLSLVYFTLKKLPRLIQQGS